MKIRSLDELENAIAMDFIWRRKEITNFRNLALSSKHHTKTMLMKVGIALLYSHWEGFVKKSAMIFCEYINGKGVKYKDLICNFHVCSVIEYFQGQYPYQNFKSTFRLVDGSAVSLDSKCKIDAEKYIDTKSNLKSEVLKEIMEKLGLDYSHYELKENLLDERFLGFRNAIAHGEYREITESDFIDLFDEVTNLIDIFKSQVLNAAIQSSYLVSVKAS
ncbi:hypothetical protein J9253_10715 [Thiothrix litoralis]|uniref:RiboL-PSP-HEPN domain-containing protein n=1 Tax=Thiothrix litoralis TaxID=2891210 RepID=A0ABX7WMK9_9GAMM|nr:MAE_28990/MAE_18760 family HEPN-like nuclease [Thiothrix litoralis]QTR44525.1 hypothetical protein J9253_10715 [Thiothrix litoralis]